MLRCTIKQIIPILNNISKSLSVELSNFFGRIRTGLSVSKQAFCKARYKVKSSGIYGKS